ncbi:MULTISPECIES: hypothetical protein [Pseudomonas]|uniref:hypothetical protein n=1 Tax=Pseudomonas TaxID=286 RepID=UPI0006D42D36|nr:MULTISPECIES: hypothetical protein [Pseudomonas]EKT4484801.1 hypothetical protein [Pseudomonas putida]EKT4528408.1 hypothetical protein [Pseudomonas putida]UFH29986.1 hypothetical protein LMH93_27120 [Pseudomonas sp. CIP-10]GJB83411.1 hypothetical protein KAM380_078760 [Aeromonas caviae]
MTSNIDEKDLKALAQRGLSLLRLTESRWMELEACRNHGTKFSLTFPHVISRSGRPNTLVLIATDGKAPTLRLGLIRSIQTISTLDSRVMFDCVLLIAPQSLNALVAGVTSTTLRGATNKLKSETAEFQPVSQKLGEKLIALIAEVPANVAVFHRILAEVGRPKYYENGHALQVNALDLALKAFGVTDGATSVALPGGHTAIGTVRLQEDAVIEHDARWISGWHLSDSDLTGKAVFTRRGEQLEVFTANKRPLEELFGVDLIYLNKARGSLVMVQYKMMEPKSSKVHRIKADTPDIDQLDAKEWTVPINAQFKSEMERMEKFDNDLSPEGPYRLNPGAFFFKLVRRHSAIKSAGIMLSLQHLTRLIEDGCTTGPRKGLRISYKALDGHYLRSDPFIELVRSGYIGTRSGTTEHLQTLIEAALTGGRSVVAAIQSAMAKG